MLFRIHSSAFREHLSNEIEQKLSGNHLLIVLIIEMHLKIQFPSKQVANWNVPKHRSNTIVGQFFFLSSAINEGINPHGVGINGIFGDHDERTWKVSLVVTSLKDSVKIRLKGLFTDEIHHVHWNFNSYTTAAKLITHPFNSVIFHLLTTVPLFLLVVIESECFLLLLKRHICWFANYCTISILRHDNTNLPPIAPFRHP